MCVCVSERGGSVGLCVVPSLHVQAGFLVCDLVFLCVYAHVHMHDEYGTKLEK